MTRPDLLLLSLGTTRGLRAADESFAEMARAAGASVEVVGVRVGATRRLQRFYPAIDLVQAVAARRAAATALARHDPRAVVVSTTTAALMAPLGRHAVRRPPRFAGGAQPARAPQRCSARARAA